MEPETTASTAPEANASPLSGVLSALLSNPNMMEQLRSVLANTSGGTPAPNANEADAASPPTDTTAASVNSTAASAGAPAPSADGLASVLADPELMAKLPQMMAVLKPMLGGDFGKKPPSPPPNRPRSAEDCRNDLLLALKPFLSPERRNAVDAMLRISKLGTVIKQIK